MYSAIIFLAVLFSTQTFAERTIYKIGSPYPNSKVKFINTHEENCRNLKQFVSSFPETIICTNEDALNFLEPIETVIEAHMRSCINSEIWFREDSLGTTIRRLSSRSKFSELYTVLEFFEEISPKNLTRNLMNSCKNYLGQFLGWIPPRKLRPYYSHMLCRDSGDSTYLSDTYGSIKPCIEIDPGNESHIYYFWYNNKFISGLSDRLISKNQYCTNRLYDHHSPFCPEKAMSMIEKDKPVMIFQTKTDIEEYLLELSNKLVQQGIDRVEMFIQQKCENANAWQSYWFCD